MAIPKKKKGEEEGPSKLATRRYSERLSVLRQAQDYSQKDDIPKAVQSYSRYLDALANYFQCDESELHPRYFEKDNNLAEILLISQVYWDLSKAYDRNPRLHKESERCLQQFLKFSIGFKFQFINSEMIRKYIKKKLAYNPKSFDRAYQKIAVQSKKCYIATYAYGEGHQNLLLLRDWKSIIVTHDLGLKFVNIYYRFSPWLIAFCEKYPSLGRLLSTGIFRPFLNSFSNLIRKFII